MVDLIKRPVPKGVMGPGLLEILPCLIPGVAGDDPSFNGPVPDAAQGSNALAQGSIRELRQTRQLAIRVAPDQLMVDVFDLHISNRSDCLDPAPVGIGRHQRLDASCFFSKVSDRTGHREWVHIDISA